MTILSTNYMPVVRIDAPEWYTDPEWLTWLNFKSVASWHTPGNEPSEHSDVFFTYSGGDGSDSPVDYPSGFPMPGIPTHIWAQICNVVAGSPIGAGGECLIWVSNLEN